MKKIIILALSSLLLTTFSSCIGYTVKSASTPFSNFKHQKQKQPMEGWENLVIYDGLDESDQYSELAKIVITGNDSASEEKLLQRMRKEAGRYKADAILHIETREVHRTSFDGISTSLNLLSIFVDSDNYLELEMTGEYITLEVEGIAIRFIED